MDWTALRLTLWAAATTTAVLLALGLPLARWLAVTRSRLRLPLETLVALPLVLPPTVLGFYLLWAFGPHSPLGRGYVRWTGQALPFSFPGLVVGLVIANLPLAVRPFRAALAGVDRQLVEASWCLGASRWRTFCRVEAPLAWPGILAGLVLTFAHCLGEFGIVLMIGGNIPGVTRTLSIAIYNDVQALDYAAAVRTSLFLLGSSALALGAVHWLDATRRRR